MRKKAKKKQKNLNFLDLSFPHLCNGRMGACSKECSMRSQEPNPSSGQDVTERVMREVHLI